MSAKTQYVVLAGINVPGEDGEETRIDAGSVTTDIPEKSIKWLTECGAIRKATKRDIDNVKGADNADSRK